MTLVVQWWFFVPFGKRGRVLHPLPVNHPQFPFIQMPDTNVTFLSCYSTVGHTRMYVITLDSPPSLPLSRPWAGLSMRRFLSSHLLIQGSSLLSTVSLRRKRGGRFWKMAFKADFGILYYEDRRPPYRKQKAVIQRPVVRSSGCWDLGVNAGDALGGSSETPMRERPALPDCYS